MSAASLLYGIRWPDASIEVGGTRVMAECLGGLALADPEVSLMVSEDDGDTWQEIEYGVRDRNAHNTVVRMPSRADAEAASWVGDVIVVRTRAGYEQWSDWEVDR